MAFAVRSVTLAFVMLSMRIGMATLIVTSLASVFVTARAGLMLAVAVIAFVLRVAIADIALQRVKRT